MFDLVYFSHETPKYPSKALSNSLRMASPQGENPHDQAQNA